MSILDINLDLRDRIRDIQKAEGRINHGPINIAGPAGNPTAPPETKLFKPWPDNWGVKPADEALCKTCFAEYGGTGSCDGGCCG